MDNAVVFAVAVTAQVLKGRLGFPVGKAFPKQVGEQPEHNAGDQLYPQKQQQVRQSPRVGQENGQGLVAGGQEHRHQGARGDQPSGVEVGGGHGEAALGDQPQQGAPHRAEGPQFGQSAGKLFAGPVLQKFDKQIGAK